MKELISSKDNHTYKEIYKLSIKKYRDKTGLYLLEGEKIIKEACRMGVVEYIVISEYYKGEIFEDVKKVFMVGKLFDRLAQTENSQGILAVAKKQNYDKDYIQSVLAKNGNIVVLDAVQDIGNVGTIIRTAQAAGYELVILIRGTADIYSIKGVRATAGSILQMPLVYMLREEAIELLKENKKITVTSLENAVDYRKVSLDNNIALVMGNEGNGVSKEFIESADIRVNIPMTPNIDSLNVAVAAGILMYSKGE